MKKVIVVASENKGKIKEISDIFYEFEVVSLKQMEKKLQKKLSVNEDKDTFVGNALQKAKELYDLIEEDVLCMGDDSGISIKALNGFPGVRTARWMDADDHHKNLNLIKKMTNIKKNNREIKYTTAIALVNKEKSVIVEFSLLGKLAREPRGKNGFGFDEIFETKSGKTLAEISSYEKYEISPRRKSLEEIKKIYFN